jgi:hypothetical protein
MTRETELAALVRTAHFMRAKSRALAQARTSQACRYIVPTKAGLKVFAAPCYVERVWTATPSGEIKEGVYL